MQCITGMSWEALQLQLHHAGNVKKWAKTSVAHGRRRTPDLGISHPPSDHEWQGRHARCQNRVFIDLFQIQPSTSPRPRDVLAIHPSTYLTASCWCYLNVSLLFWLCNRPDLGWVWHIECKTIQIACMSCYFLNTPWLPAWRSAAKVLQDAMRGLGTFLCIITKAALEVCQTCVLALTSIEPCLSSPISGPSFLHDTALLSKLIMMSLISKYAKLVYQ